VRIYVAGPLFTPGDRRFLDELADTLGNHGHECFEPSDAATIFAVDSAGKLVRSIDAVIATLADWHGHAET
jgi:nucleoside 2-deoxyribosyltransferase